jgi:hypothetical protein
MPPKNVGTLTLADLLKNTNQSPVQFGLDAIMTVVDRDLATHNRLTTDLVSTFADITTDVRRRYGVSDTIEFRPADEFTRAHTQKVGAQAVVEFPLENDQAALGWTAMFFRQKSVADLARSQIAAQRGHLLSIRQKLMQAMFGATNYTFTDYLDTQIDLGVKRFVNADGAPIPDGPNAVQFDGTTHTHYLWTAGLTNAGAHALVDTVVEHHDNPRPVIYINKADEIAWRALADFKAYTDVRLVQDITGGSPVTRLNPFKTDDVAIGLFGAAEVWKKPWALSNYAICLDLGDNTPKPLVARVREGGNGIGMRTVATNVLFPLQADYMEHEFGFGVWERTAGAIYYFAAGAVAYVEPQIVPAY